MGRVRPQKSLGLENAKANMIWRVNKDEKVIYRHKHDVKQKEPTYIDIKTQENYL